MESTNIKSSNDYNKIILALLSIIGVVILGMVLKNASSIFIPFVLAIFLSFILNPVITFFEKLHFPGVLATLLTVILAIVVIGLIGIFIKGSIESFITEFPKYENRINDIVENLLRLLSVSSSTSAGQSTLQDNPQLVDLFENFSVPSLIKGMVASMGSFLSSSFLIFLILMFLLAGRKQFTKKSYKAFNSDVSEKIVGVVTKINDQIQKYLVAKTLVSLVTALLVGVVLYLFDIEFIGIWMLLTFLLNFIPNVGSLVATLLPVPIAIIQYDNFGIVIWMVVCILIIQLVIGNVVEPKIVGKRINLSPLVLLFSLALWGYIWGIVGMFLAVPLMVMIRIIFENIDGLRFISVYMGTGVKES